MTGTSWSSTPSSVTAISSPSCVLSQFLGLSASSDSKSPPYAAYDSGTHQVYTVSSLVSFSPSRKRRWLTVAVEGPVLEWKKEFVSRYITDTEKKDTTKYHFKSIRVPKIRKEFVSFYKNAYVPVGKMMRLITILHTYYSQLSI